MYSVLEDMHKWQCGQRSELYFPGTSELLCTLCKFSHLKTERDQHKLWEPCNCRWSHPVVPSRLWKKGYSTLSEISSWITSSSEAFPRSQYALHCPPCFPHLHLILLQVWSLSSHDPSSWEGRQSVPYLCGCHHCCFFLLQWTINNPILWAESWQLWFSPIF